jgi:hypothetical protein
VTVRAALLYAGLAAAVIAAAVAASVVLLSSTRGDERIGQLRPVARLPATTLPSPPSRPARTPDHAHEQDD